MSLIVEKFLVCDKCGETIGVDNRQDSAREHRHWAKQEGWVYRVENGSGKDYCDQCK